MDESYNEEIDVRGIDIYDYSGYTKTRYNEVYIQSYFSELLIDKWLPYFECHQCGRFDYCKFVKLKPQSKTRSYDIKCGVVSDVIRNFLKNTSVLYKTLSIEERQNYFDGLYYLQKYVYKTELMIGLLMNDEYIGGFGNDHGPGLFGGELVDTRETLEKVASLWKNIKRFSSVQCLLIVEGKTELFFVEELKKGGLIWFSNIKVEAYNGANNKRMKKIQMLIENYHTKGYKIFLQGDADGRKENIFQEHIKTGLLKPDNTFQFEYDFESSIPTNLLYYTLKELSLIKRVSLKRFRLIVDGQKGKDLKVALTIFKIDIDKHKINIAIKCAQIMYQSVFWSKGEFYNTELGRFTKFLENISD